MRSIRMLLRALGVERAMVPDANWEDELGRQVLLVRVCPRTKDGMCSPDPVLTG